MEMQQNFDAIVVGSGMGGLTVASILSSRYGSKVLVLEKHGKLGGFTHVFKRPKPGATDPDLKYEFDVGVHYVGEMQKDTHPRRAMDAVTGGALEWAPMPDHYDRISYPGFRFDVPTGRENFQKALIDRFPSEEKAIRRYFQDVKKAQDWMMRHQLALNLPQGPWGEWLRKPGRDLALGHLGDYLKTQFRDPKLRAVLDYLWWDHGIPPSRCPFVTHAIIANHYWEGAFYPVGGSSQIASSVRAVIEKAGGTILLKTEVKKVVTEGGRAVGVETADGRTYRAPLVFSNVGLQRTFEDLLGQSVPAAAAPVFQEPEFTVVTLYLGLKDVPVDWDGKKIRGENFWLSDVASWDSEDAWRKKDELLQGKAWAGYLSFPSLKDPEGAAKTGLVTAELFAAVSRDAFEKWNGTSKSRRGEDYVELKTKISNALIELAERHLPGFRAQVDFQELATPLTIEHYSSHRRGTIYGAPAVRARFESGVFRPRTPIPGLYLCGTDAAAHGVTGALIGGLVAIGSSKGWRKILHVLGSPG